MKKLPQIIYSRAFMPLWALIFGALFGHSLYSFSYEYPSGSLPLILLYGIIPGISFGVIALLLYAQKREKGRLIAFLAFVLGFEAMFWAILTLINSRGLYADRAISVSFGVALPVFGAVCLLALINAAKKKLKVLNRVLAVLLCAGFFAAGVFSALPAIEEISFKINYTENPQFSPIPAGEVKVQNAERENAYSWLNENILSPDDGVPAFDFSLNGEKFSENTDKWEFELIPVSESDETHRGARSYELFGRNSENGIVLRVEAAYYEKNATVEWTVYLKNEGEENSSVISDFYAVSGSIETGEAGIYCARGSSNSALDFSLLKINNAAKNHTFSGTGGRPSDEYMPYFNISGKTLGAVLAIGWTGQWRAELKQKGDKTEILAGQEKFNAYLLPGEEVRSPLVSLSFYSGGNPVKGFNTFRNWILDSVYPENTPYFLNDLDVLYVSHTRTAEEIKADVSAYSEENLAKVDNFWMDAGWYAGCVNGWGDGVGNWYTTDERFPGGLREISGLAAESGSGLVVWFEPERLTHGSYLFDLGQENPQWIIDLDPKNGNNSKIMFNLADENAEEFLADYIGRTLKENGIKIYRQDFNFEPLKYWKYADKNFYGGREGICENHYVSGLYAYLDKLCEINPGLVIDNCSAGGRRLDLEMARRSIPLWRTDYNCEVHPDSLEANQSHTYNLSLWMPVSGVNIDLSSDYAAISSIFSGNLFTYDSFGSEFFGRYDEVRKAMVKNYYPVSCAGNKSSGITAMQYGNEETGYMLIYKHEDEPSGEYSVSFSGLNSDDTYNIIHIDASSEGAGGSFSGEQLMRGAYSLSLFEGRAAFVIKYDISG
ncbi:MAG: alpha-galactosidase [Oscillospiraceae bacterium]|nr:alpha-galactosidase [Oscillospiraceae bacterium]